MERHSRRSHRQTAAARGAAIRQVAGFARRRFGGDAANGRRGFGGDGRIGARWQGGICYPGRDPAEQRYQAGRHPVTVPRTEGNLSRFAGEIGVSRHLSTRDEARASLYFN